MKEASLPSGAYPRGLFNAYLANFFNAISFQIIIGAPIILYAKSLGSSSTVLGIISALLPLTNIFQLPAAHFLGRYGFKEFVLIGWRMRAVILFFLALIPFLSFLDNTSKLAIMITALFVFHLLRGISSAAWLPWLTALIPENIRGRYLSLEQIFVHLGFLLALIVSAVVMQGHVNNWEYALVFFISGIGGTLAFLSIKKIPDVPMSDTTKRSAHPVPWRAIIGYDPFRRLLIFNIVFMAVIGGLGVFTVEYLRDIPKFDPDTILYLSAVSLTGALLSLPFAGYLIDRAGSKPMMAVAIGLIGLVIFGWFLIAAGVLPISFNTICILNFLLGMAGSNFNVGNIRLVMLTMPEMGRNHFFALFSVITSLGLGATPILWGFFLDAIGTYELVLNLLTFRRHSIYFLGICLINFVSLALVFQLTEKTEPSKLSPNLVYVKLKRIMRDWMR